MSQLPAEVPDGHLRVTGGQRDNAVAILREAAADGRLTFDELDQRVEVALGARTRAELAAGLFDLVATERMSRALEMAAPVGDGPGYRWEEPLVVTGHWRRTTRLAGGWELPPFLEVITDFVGAVKLDMTHASTRTRVIDLVVASAGGTITLVVPQGWGVDAQGVQTDGMNAGLSSRVPTRPEGMPHALPCVAGPPGG